MFYVLYGEEEYRRSEEVSRFRAEMARDGMGEMNVTMLDGRRLELRALMDACSALPFLSERRLVIVQDMLRRFDPAARRAGADDAEDDAEEPARGALGKEEAERLCAYLPTMPASTRLVFLESGRLSKRNPVLRLAQSAEGGYAKEFEPLAGAQLERWTAQRAQEKGTPIDRDALQALLLAVGNDLRRLDQELDKLSALAGYTRGIVVDDVEALVSADVEQDIFALVDSLGHRQAREAMHRLQVALRAQANELYLLSMVARQIRLLVSVKDLVERATPQPEIQRILRLHPFVLHKLLPQAGKFSAAELVAIQERILAADQAIKTGRVEPVLALEMLVLEICRRSGDDGPYQGSSRSRTRSARASSFSSPEPRSK